MITLSCTLQTKESVYVQKYNAMEKPSYQGQSLFYTIDALARIITSLFWCWCTINLSLMIHHLQRWWFVTQFFHGVDKHPKFKTVNEFCGAGLSQVTHHYRFPFLDTYIFTFLWLLPDWYKIQNMHDYFFILLPHFLSGSLGRHVPVLYPKLLSIFYHFLFNVNHWKIVFSNL